MKYLFSLSFSNFSKSLCISTVAPSCNDNGINSFRETGDFRKAIEQIFEAPSHAITRNILVIAIGFVPMFFASLVPYVTVSAFFFAIMMVSGFTTLFAFPAILSFLNPAFLAGKSKAQAPATASH